MPRTNITFPFSGQEVTEQPGGGSNPVFPVVEPVDQNGNALFVAGNPGQTGSADGGHATIGTTSDASSALTLVGLLKAIKAAVQGVLSVAQQGSGTLYAGTLAATTTAAAIAGSQAVVEVVVQNDPGSAANLIVGNATTQAVVLAPGASITIPVSNLNLVFAKTPSSTATANYLGRS